MAGRNLVAEREGVQKAQQISIYILGWAAQALGIVAGAYAANAWPGGAIRWVFNLMPGDWLIPLTLFIGFIVWAIDIINDLTPNQAAVTFGFMAPILAQGTDSTLALRVRDWSDALQAGVGGQIAPWVGNVGAGWLSVALMATAVIIGKRVLQKQASAAGRGGGGGR
ncbi:hypothetical protein AMIS_20500 [Actinoplanes missouriensis 431]|uniref:Uncharacterized protein n=1 Tax=Actinoplanes missouriensis (strain ATCC 14538 / DSM 43046 / CBS 188.64 / JCM 3121 / NBRC 102363 / NCIMB 12654 / NRRL B-3342 / UNCC 431) TaxID=512565 RepID=I0H2N3_ACTM4|nr:hypothetical protein [Actinoplanes missouriensis]BAL87270.1 hypothetical protein AMIS_20500 [Actinoplanes missouriensis 431]